MNNEYMNHPNENGIDIFHKSNRIAERKSSHHQRYDPSSREELAINKYHSFNNVKTDQSPVLRNNNFQNFNSNDHQP